MLAEAQPWGRLPRPVALLGWPVGHSLSPAMHNAAFRGANVAAVYVAAAVAPADVVTAVRGLRALGFVGANVTIPHKEAVLPALDEVDPAASLLGAVNTITVRDGRLLGANTDGDGFLAHLRSEGCNPAGLRTVILGAGGAARAVAAALAQAGVAHLAVLNRTPERAAAVADLARRARATTGVGGGPVVAPAALSVTAAPLAGALAAELVSQADLLVNCTAVGLGQPDDTPWPEVALLPVGAVVYDTVYRPAETRLLRAARERGLRGIGGLGMLVHQGALSWEWWFGQRGPVATMWSAASAALES